MFDENTTCLYLGSIAMRWLAVRIDTLAGNVYKLEHEADVKFSLSVPCVSRIFHLDFGTQVPCGGL
jgi:hypothetical protein